MPGVTNDSRTAVARIHKHSKQTWAPGLDIEVAKISFDPRRFEVPIDNQHLQAAAGKQESELLAGGMRAAGKGFFIQPTVFGDVPPTAKISLEEIFGPVLALIKAKDFDHAIEIANNTEYGLTGAVYSNKREHLERARRDFHVGNLYFNRKCTGALVGVHPFGGFNMSGTDSKAGGRDYLLLFTQAKVMSEKVK